MTIPLDIKNIAAVIQDAKAKHCDEIVIGKDVSFSDEGYNGLLYMVISLNKNTIMYTTDVPEYISKKLEDRLETLHTTYGIIHIAIDIHSHDGKIHDKNFTLQISADTDIADLVTFILKKFFKISDLDYATRQISDQW